MNLTPAQRRTLQAVADGARSAAVTMGRLYDAGLVTDGPDWSGRVVAALTETGGAALETGAGR